MNGGAPDRRIYFAAAALFLAVLLNCRWWSARIPPNGAPDEYDHFAVQRFVAQHGRLPAPTDEGVVSVLDVRTRRPYHLQRDAASGRWDFPAAASLERVPRYEMHVAYLFSVVHLAVGQALRQGNKLELQAARACNGLLIALAAALVCLAGARLNPQRPALGLAAGLWFGFWPQLSFLGAYVNDDAFAVFASALAFFAAASIDAGGWRRAAAATLGLAVGLLLLAKANALCGLLPAALWLAWRLKRDGRAALRPLALAAAVAAAAGGWFPLLNAVRYGDWFGLGVVRELYRSAFRALPADLAPFVHTPYVFSLEANGIPLSAFPLGRWFGPIPPSAYGVFGWMNQPLPWPMYAAAAGLVLVALAGWAATSNRRADHPPPSPALAALSLPYVVLLLALSAANSYRADFQPQGRYLLAAAPATMALLSMGAARWPGALGRALPAAATVIFVALNAIARAFVL
jgi:4-amino-4-deoxy-L-arabinose transferase-like glycosyltransferase